MLMKIPIYHDGNVMDWQPLCLDLPTCVKRENNVSTVYKCFTEVNYFEVSVLKDDTFRLVNHLHTKHKDFVGNHGVIYERVGMLRNDFEPCEIEELIEIINRFNVLLFDISNHLTPIEA